MAISKQQARKTKQPVLSGDEQISTVINSSATSYSFEITGPSKYFTLQSNGSLTYTWAVSANGSSFGTPSATIAAGAFSTYTGPDVVAVIQITRVSGSGQVTMLAV
jgi:hypothetical protein